jgi:hypothetical protein
MHEVRRSLERRTAGDRHAQPGLAMSRTDRLVKELRELVAALDRRVPQVERAGELTIAREAEALRSQALRRLAELGDQSAASRVVEPVKTRR